AMPRLILPSLQINMRAGQMPPADEHGDVMLKVPINKL
ncbi:MAG: MBL fold metallo-hydrolase, partial [Pseudomonadota bacterium]